MRWILLCGLLAILVTGCRPSRPASSRPGPTAQEKLPPEVTDDPASALPRSKR